MRILRLVVPANRVSELWLETETRAYFLARQSAHGLDRMGWHNNHGQIKGDWRNTDEVIDAYHLDLQ